jgi:hypothetical protein
MLRVKTNDELRRLSDEQILEIFQRLRADGCPRCIFLEHYAAALATAPRRDFMIMRPVSLILISKYNLSASIADRGDEDQLRAG